LELILFLSLRFGIKDKCKGEGLSFPLTLLLLLFLLAVVVVVVCVLFHDSTAWRRGRRRREGKRE